MRLHHMRIRISQNEARYALAVFSGEPHDERGSVDVGGNGELTVHTGLSEHGLEIVQMVIQGRS